jgi:hypothetical protein
VAKAPLPPQTDRSRAIPRVSESLKKEFGRRIEAMASERGMHQVDVAREATKYMPAGREIGRDAVSHYFRGVSLPLGYRLAALCKALECEPEDLIPSKGTRASVPSRIGSAEEASDGRVNIRLTCTGSIETASKLMMEAAVPGMTTELLSDGNADIRLNRAVSMKTASKIMRLLDHEAAAP